jgi:hypothetical protein
MQGRTIHPNSLKNLRPPWRRGESGNPKGRPRSGGNRHTLWANRFGRFTIEDYCAFYLNRLRALEADPTTKMYAQGIAVRDLEAKVLQHLGPIKVKFPNKGHLCCRCGILLHDPVPLANGPDQFEWYHANCAVPELRDRSTSVRPIVDAVLAAAIPEKGAGR